MNRCIHCTRCIRFSNDVAGAPEFGSTGRGNDIQIGTYLETALDTELSGNVIDLCPVGALTSKPYAFRARPWELQHTESVDVMNGMGSNIRVDTKGLSVMRVLPRLNDDVNEEWIDDKTRFACDGLNNQRLTTPLIRRNNEFQPATWEQALVEISDRYKTIAPKGDELKFIAGHLVETESLVAAKDLANRLGSENLALDQPQGSAPAAHGIDIRSNYTFNSGISGVEEADAILLIGTNPRWEAAVLNARIRKQWIRSDLEVGLVGQDFDSTFEYQKLGETAADIKSALAGQFGKLLSQAQRPMIIVGSSAVEHADAKSIFEQVGTFVEKNKSKFQTPEWNGYNVLQRAASRTGAYDVGFTVSNPQTANTTPKFVWLLGADEVAASEIPKDAFVVYQGHHGDRGAQLADIVLPAAAYTEKNATYVNTEGRVQVTRAAVSLLGAARPDWKILRATSEVLGVPLPYDELEALRDRMEEITPTLRKYDIAERTSVGAALGKIQLVDANRVSAAKSSSSPSASSSSSSVPPAGSVLKTAIQDFYFTDSISRSSPTMARCSAAKAQKNAKTNFMAPGEPAPQVHYGPASGPPFDITSDPAAQQQQAIA